MEMKTLVFKFCFLMKTPFSEKTSEQVQTTFYKESPKRASLNNLGSPRSSFQIIN